MITNEEKLNLEARIAELESKLAEATKPQEPAHWRAVLCAEQVQQQLIPTAHVVGFRKFSDAESWVASKLDFDGWRYTLEPLYTTPQTCLKCAELEAELTKRPPMHEDTRANVAVAVARRRGQFIGAQDERIAELTRIIATQRAEIDALKGMK